MKIFVSWVGFLFACIFCMMSLASFADGSDSLVTAYKSRPAADTVSVALLGKIALSYSSNDPDSALYFARLGLAIEKKATYEKGRAACYETMVICFQHKNQADSGFFYNRAALAILEKGKDSAQLASAYYDRSNLYLRQMDYKNALADLNRVVSICKNTHDLNLLGLTYDDLGSCQLELGNTAEALKQYLLAVTTYETSGKPDGLLTVYGSAAKVYSMMGDTTKSVEFMRKSMAYYEKVASIHSRIVALNDAAFVSSNAGDQQAAIDYLKRSIALSDSCGMKGETLMACINIAEICRELNDFHGAEQYYNKILGDPGITETPDLQAQALKGIGTVLIEQHKYQPGISDLLKAYDLFLASGQYPDLVDVTTGLTTAYKQTGDYKSALKYNELKNTYEDSVQNKSALRKIEKVQFDYELAKKQQKIELLENNKTATQKLDRQRSLLIWGLAIFILILGTLICLLERKNRKEEKLLFEARERELEMRQQAASLAKLNEFNKKTFSVISHDLRGPISSLTLTLSMLMAKEMEPEEFEQFLPEMVRQLNSLRLLMDNLLNWARGTMDGGFTLKHANVKLKKLADQTLNLFEDQVKEKKLTIVNNLNDDYGAYCDGAQADIVLRNLVSNAIKFTNAGKKITINGTIRDGKAWLSVADQGVGMDATKVSNLLNGISSDSTFGTAGEKGMGVGLRLSFELIKANMGDLLIDSTPGKGTTFTMVLPGEKVQASVA